MNSPSILFYISSPTFSEHKLEHNPCNGKFRTYIKKELPEKETAIIENFKRDGYEPNISTANSPENFSNNNGFVYCSQSERLVQVSEYESSTHGRVFCYIYFPLPLTPKEISLLLTYYSTYFFIDAGRRILTKELQRLVREGIIEFNGETDPPIYNEFLGGSFDI